jgi:parallel beta-helix repeat protein
MPVGRVSGVRTGTPTIRGNTVTGATTDGIHVRLSVAAPWIVDNTIEDVGQVGISVASGAPRLEGNTISRSGRAGISVIGSSTIDGRPAVIGNVLRDNATAVLWSADAGVIEDNDVSGGGAGILVGDGSPTVTGNGIEGVEGRGLFVGGRASPTFSGNTSCGNGENLVVEDGATPTMDDTNEICEDAPAE